MSRREFLSVSAGALAAATIPSYSSVAPGTTPAADDTRAHLIGRFEEILRGFLRNARATSPDFTVCDFPGGKKLVGCCTPSGKTFTSVARMLPAMADFVVSGVQPTVDGVDLNQVLLSIYRTAFDPEHPDYWGEPPDNKPTQRTVESSLVAIALARLGPSFVEKLSPKVRSHINRWLASCTVVPERGNNHAWFTATNQAARIKLGKTFREFQGDERWMLDDLEAMDVLAANAADGWYSDDPKLTVYDYYNFWTFGNFPLFWSRIAGDLYPDWNAKLRARGREFLQTTPAFFAADGGVPLFGRSLLYKWCMLSPLVLSYEQGIWPHSPGLLRRIMRKNFDWWWQLGAYDRSAGKLRETMSPEGTPEVTENYIDNGHPYWAMLAFTFFSIPASDPLWTRPEEKLPVEKKDYLVRLPGPKMILAGTKSSGQVRWLQALNSPRREYYRDKYNKFVYSSGFPFNILKTEKHSAPWDQALVFRDPSTGDCAWRMYPDEGELLPDGVRTAWSAEVAGGKVKVVTTIRLAGEFEFRNHQISFTGASASAAKPNAIELLEGSYPLGLRSGDVPREQKGLNWHAISADGKLLVSWIIAGHESSEVVTGFPPKNESKVNLVSPRMAIISLKKRVELQATDKLELMSLHYASPKPASMYEIQRNAKRLMKAWR